MAKVGLDAIGKSTPLESNKSQPTLRQSYHAPSGHHEACKWSPQGGNLQGSPFESSLERDFLLLLDFDPDVEFYEEQPVKITYHDDRGRRRTYTPDVFVRYRADRLQGQHT